MKKTRLLCILSALVLTLGIVLGACGTTETTNPTDAASPSPEQSASASATSDTRTFTDSAGREVTLTGQAQKIAALRGSSHEKALFFGRAANVILSMEPTDWAYKVFPDFQPEIAQNAQEPNVEELVQKGVDLVLFWNTPEVLESLEAAGIPAVVGSDEQNKTINSWEDFAQWMKDDLYVYAQAMGGQDALDKAEKWCEYADQVFKEITDVTSQLDEEDLPTVYYVRGPEITSTHAGKSITLWYVTMAGGNMVTKDLDTKIAEVSLEDIITWDPEYIFMGRLNSTEPITSVTELQEVSAVKNNQVYVNPCGVYEWDYGTEGVLFVQYLAKTLHPDLFTDLDLEAEVKWYYQEFYDYTLTDDDVERILNNMSPAA